jgi:hypothetical protein
MASSSSSVSRRFVAGQAFEVRKEESRMGDGEQVQGRAGRAVETRERCKVKIKDVTKATGEI